MSVQATTVERVVARLAHRQYGVVSRRQLLAAGLTRDQIGQRLLRGDLIQVYRGVYRVGHAAPSPQAHYLAAVFVCGDKAVLSGLAAAWLWGLTRGAPSVPEVTCPGKRRVKGVVTHRPQVPDGEWTTRHRIPVTTVARTLVDLAASLDDEQLARACHEAGVKYRTTPRQVEQVLQRRPNLRGAARLRAVLTGAVPVTLSQMERKFIERLKTAGLPLPVTNKVASERRIDCRWPEHRLTVELDSYRYHATRHAWERDREREREAYERGDQLRRYTWRDVFEAPERMLRELAGLLDQPFKAVPDEAIASRLGDR